MNFKNLLPIAALLAPAIAAAMPATPDVIVMTNPDGKQVTVRGHGNQHFHFLTDEEGLYIMEKNSAGFWTRAERNGAYLMNVEADIDRLMTEKFGEPQIATPFPREFDYDTEGRSTFPTIGDNVHSLVVLLEYPDLKFTMDDPVGFYSRYLNEENFTFEDLSGSARDYFVKTSGGKFKPTFEVMKYDMPNNYAYYNDNNWHAEMEKVLHAIDDQVDFTRYDYDEDGYIDTVYFIYSGYGQADTFNEDFMWPHQSSLKSRKIFLDGKQASNYACSNSLRGGVNYKNEDLALAGIGTFCHEFSHVLGLPDLYNTVDSRSAQAPGEWSIMAGGPYNNDGRTPPEYSAYERYVAHWIELEEAESGKSYTLKPISDEPRGIRVSIPNAKKPENTLENEYYVLENRTQKGYDTYLPGQGMLIWHVDYLKALWISNTVNNDNNRQRCSVFYPEGGTRNDAAWPYHKGNSTYTYDYIAAGYPSQIKVASKLGTAEGVNITNIKYNTDTQEVTFDYNVIDGAYNDKPAKVLIEREKNEYGYYTQNFNVTWPEVEGATDYLVTVICHSGKDIIINGFEKKFTGGKCEANFQLNEAMQKLPLDVEVYAYNGTLPSVEPAKASLTVSNINNWPYDNTSGIEIIGSDKESYADIYGGQGEVIAPAGAEVYTINGVQAGMRNLPAGIYIVRYGKRVEKVVVK